ncbi:glycine/betaine-binding protein [Planomonospora parontospora subsp. parontospora]|uniref:Glycine/betaine-binding protein n=3 Tax=Planomonospora parontospora TaxID=58119 RepID=A0AA37BIA6_9ACTN|nr:glycine/betaine-binding protein [Planomonospora parontospora]GII09519.1 glycine/betaine-binding protein [Planomonospora parontospora subsp. parontospora]
MRLFMRRKNVPPGGRRRTAPAAGPAGLAVLLLLTSCSAQQAAPERTGGTVRIAINDWAGYRASAAVLALLLERELGYEVQEVELTEARSWEAFEQGTVDVIVENWGREAEKKTYIEEKKVAVSAGRNGNKGIIGWYVPQWMAEKYPDITDWRNLNKYAPLFRTAKTGNQGQILDGDPSYVTNDEALVRNLDLDYKVVYSGSEDALIKAARRATARREPLLMYFYEPQWLFTQVKLVKVNLPPYAIGCDADAEKVACDYPPYLLDKIVSRRFADTGGKAYELVRNFSWTNAHQNAVARDMTEGGMSAEEAARAWVDANRIVWKDWMPR